MTTLFTVPISSTGGSIVCTNPSTAKEHETIYVLTFSSPPDNRLTPIFIDALLLALDIVEHRYPKGVLVTTSGIAKFYSNGLDLDIVKKTKGFCENWIWRLFRRFLTYPMPTVCLLNGHAFAAGFMLAMYHDYRIMNPDRGFLCINELEFGVPLQTPMMSIFREKLTPVVFRTVVLEAHRFGGRNALQANIVDAVGGAEEALALIQTRKLQTKAATGIYGTMKEEMYCGILNGLDNHFGNLQWRKNVEAKNQAVRERGLETVQQFEKDGKAKL